VRAPSAQEHECAKRHHSKRLICILRHTHNVHREMQRAEIERSLGPVELDRAKPKRMKVIQPLPSQALHHDALHESVEVQRHQDHGSGRHDAARMR
jgi:hypothetical protein